MARKKQIISLADALTVHGPELGSRLKYIHYSFAGVPNVYLAVYQKGARVFQFKKTRRGATYSLTIGALGDITMNDALAAARLYREMIMNGIDPRSQRTATGSITLQAFVDEHFWPFAKESYKSCLNLRNMLDNRIIPVFGPMSLKNIDHRLIRNFQRSICEEINKRTGNKVGGATANRTLSLLSSLFRYAIEEKFVEINPCIGVRKARENKSRDRYLLRDEYPRFMQALRSFIDRPQAKAILVMTALGLRPGEVLNLAFRDLHLADNQIFIRDPKNGESRHVSLNSIARDVFCQLHEEKEADAQWVFPSSSKSGHLRSVRRTFKAICTKANLSHFQLRDLRRSHATQLLRFGVDLFTIKEVLGHKSLKSTLVYARVPSRAMADANELAASKLLGEVSKVPVTSELSSAVKA